jgi:hypothetical protein
MGPALAAMDHAMSDGIEPSIAPADPQLIQRTPQVVLAARLASRIGAPGDSRSPHRPVPAGDEAGLQRARACVEDENTHCRRPTQR